MVSGKIWEPSRSTLFFTIVTGIILLIFFCGAIATVLIGNRVDSSNRNKLLLRAQNASLLIDAASIQSLSATDADLENPAYTDLKNKMIALAAINPDTQFVYLMGYENGKLFFFVDSESPGSPDYSPPGQIYEETNDLEINNYINAVSFVEGPYTDAWGTWMSAYAPIIDPATNEVVAIIGLDASARPWQMQILSVRLVIAAITVLLSLLVLTLMLFLRKSYSSIEQLKSANAKLSIGAEHLREAESIAKLGSFTWNLKNNIMLFSDQMYALTGIAQGSRVKYEDFSAMIHAEDMEYVKNMIEQAFSSDVGIFNLQYRFILKNGMERQMFSICTVRRGPDREPNFVIGTAQDITDIQKAHHA